MTSDEIDRLWKTLDKTSDLANQTAINLASMTETVRADQARISKVENHPLAFRGWLSVCLAAGGCLSMLVGSALSVITILVTVLIQH